jgi:periplasmic protein TonB
LNAKVATMPELDSSPTLSVRVWVLAALGAVAIHVGAVALAVAHMRYDEDDDLGAPAIEIGLELMAPRVDATDLPPGPNTDASAASPPVVEQKTSVEQTELPKAVPTETDDPDRVVALNDTKRPKEEVPEVQTVQAAPSVESVAVEATAPPSSEAIQEAPNSVAPAQGSGETARRVRVTWQKELIAHLDKHKRYPPTRANQSAQIVVGFVLDRTGHILSTNIVKGSGDTAFDEAALAMLRRADPVPPPPPLIADEGLSFSLPVIFRVKGRS